MDDLVTIVLAAGKGTRMKSRLVKVLHPVAGCPMITYPVQAARKIGCKKVVVVVGHQHERVRTWLGDAEIAFVYQEKQLGSGHAVAVTQDCLKGFEGDVLILCGDVPLITSDTLQHLLAEHRQSGASVSVLSVVLDDPAGYGRIVRNDAGDLTAIVEDKDASAEQKRVREINTGLYCCSAPFLFDAVKRVSTDNEQKEYYLPDIVSIAASRGKGVRAVVTDNTREVMGINDRSGLAEAEKIMRKRILTQHMKQGVTVIDPDSTYIDGSVQIGQDTVVYPNSVIRDETTIGSGCVIEINCCVSRSVIGNDVHIKPSCVIDESCIKDRVIIGPFAHIRPEAVIEEDAKIGNFVEIKKSHIGKASKASHLTYLGDATVGEDVNVGAGTITCNYDGKRKHPTVIDDGAFIGSNTALVAPVRVGKKAVIGAGSTITKKVPDNTLAVARGRQRNYDNFFGSGLKKDKKK